MSLVRTNDRLELPETLQTQLYEFRRLVWSIKMTSKAVCARGGLRRPHLHFLVLFVLDRFGETPTWTRVALFVLMVVSCTVIPVSLHRWVWRNRHLEQLARLLTRKHPHVGDQLLGIIPSSFGTISEQAAPASFCVAAVRQVAEDAQKRDFRDSVPNPRHRLWTALALIPLASALALLAIFPAAEINAWARLLAPWRATPRYTFAVVDKLPDRVVVAHGEPFSLALHLTPQTMTKPREGFAQLGRQPSAVAPLREGGYAFDLPPQIVPASLQLAVGDWRQQVHVEPMARPELTSATAEVSLPSYLGLPKPQTKDVRGGTISPVNGSRIRLLATASRELSSSQVNGHSEDPAGSSIASPPIEVKGTGRLQLLWQDRLGLTGKEPFTLTIVGHDDEPPTLVCEGLPRQKVVLDSEMLSFKIHARDDFGVRRVGMEWNGIDNPAITKSARGERILAGGGNDKEALDVSGTFSAKSLGIEPQLLRARVFVEDYFPGRKRVYAPASFLYVLNPEQHSIWLTEQLSKWHRQSLEVRDREMQLYETNKQLRALSPQELDRPETRRRIETQASAEFANGRRLSNLVRTGEDLVQQATRNPEFGVGHLEKWAEMLQILKDIAANRMPSVADLLKQASQAPQSAPNPSANKSAMVGQVRAVGAGKPSSTTPSSKKQAGIPKVVDTESTQQPPGKQTEQKPPKSSQSNPRLTLPMTTLIGGKSPPESKDNPAAGKMDEAIKKQEDLLAEFEKVADELKRVLAELEGSTLVKRLKAASRVQYKVAGRIGDQVNETFGKSRGDLADTQLAALGQIGEQEVKEGDKVSLIMDDMEAYFDRHRFVKIKTVLDDMRKQDVVGNLRELAGDLNTERGLSIAQCEYWSDTLDRWAEDLVDPACCGACPGCKAKGSLPPSVVLEVLQILEGEMNLREETRVSEQARPTLSAEDYKQDATKLSQTQNGLRDRVVKVIGRIRALPDAESDFGKELHLLAAVTAVMEEARGILAQSNTGRAAIGAETEVIELLLQSRRFNPKGGGGSGGSNPGGGGGGTTQDFRF